MNTCEYSVIPQNRERIFIIGFLDRKMYKNFIFPEKINNTKDFKLFLDDNVDKKYFYTNNVVIYNKLVDSVVDKSKIY